MKPQQTNKCKDIILVSMPWSLFSRPSIQIGALKAYLKLQFPYLNIAAHHFYLKVAETIGYKLYHSISESTWLAETIYAAMLSPEKLKTIEKIFYKEAKNKPLCRKLIFKELVSKVRKVTDSFIESINWNKFCLAGFSVSQCQLTSSLYIIKQIKTKYPDLKIVLGGSTFAGASKEVFKLISEIDFVVKGEGELPLSQLVHLLSISNKTDIPTIKGVISRESLEHDSSDMFYQMETLNGLPMPDFDDYFDLLQTFGSKKTFFPTILCEISRGCWWRYTQRLKKIKGCAFCNLNLQWDGYRSKGPSKVVSEVDKLTSRHKSLSVAFADNALPVKESKEVFTQLKELNKDFRFFSEIRATTTLENLKIMRDAGMIEVQIGIESLSTRLLRKLNKGTTAIQNLEIMKNCERLGIVNNSNLILQFPGSDMNDVEETLRNLEFAAPFRPLRQVNFWLGLESPVWQNPQQFEIKALYNHPRYADLLPQNISSSMRFLIQAYRGDLGYQKKLWQPVKERIKAWKTGYESLHNNPIFEPILSFLDGRDFLIIIQKQLNDRILTHRLKGKSREIYLFCQHYRSIKKILEHFPELSDDKIISFLQIMVSKKLMFEENEKYLSLAVPK